MKKLLALILALFVIEAIYGQQGINNPFFEKVSYIGAFDETNDWTANWVTWDAENTNYPATTVTKSGEISANETWTASNVYKIEGFLYVLSGVTLTIEPGTIIRGDKTSKGTLIIERGAKLIAEGTAENPIVFTSNEAVGNREYGDWGGVILCGKAPINVPGGEAQIEGGPRSKYGGSDITDNSGSLKYIRIEFPGIPFVPDKEINGITFGGVGNATTVDYIQIYRSGDDAFEWFGGSVNAKHLVASYTWDDDFDTDYGYSGMVQFAVALRDPAIADPGSGSNGFESDNDGSGSGNTPITNPIFSNVSMFGPKALPTTTINTNYKRALHLRRNTKINIYNSIFAGFKDGLFVDGSAARQNLTNDELKIYNVILAGNSGKYFVDDSLSVVRNYFFNSTRKNDTLASNADLKITDPFNFTTPDFRPMASSPVLNSSCFVGIEDFSNQNVSSLNIYPNPVSDFMNIEFFAKNNSSVIFEIVDMSGKLVYQNVETASLGENIFKLDLQNLNSGIYALRMIDGNEVNVVKFIK